MGDDWVWRCDSVFSSAVDNGEVARSGEDESGDETEGRWSQPVKIGAGANDNISLEALSFSGINDEWIEN